MEGRELLGGGEGIEGHDRDCQEAKKGDDDEVKGPELGRAMEGIVDGREGGANDHQHNPDIIALVPCQGNRVGMAAEEVEQGAEEEATNGTDKEAGEDKTVSPTLLMLYQPEKGVEGEDDEEEGAKEVGEHISGLVVEDQKGLKAVKVGVVGYAVASMDPGVVPSPFL